MGDDACDSHVQGLGDVDQGLAVFQDGRDELVHEVAVGAAVAAGATPGGSGGRLVSGRSFPRPSYSCR